MPPSRPTLHVPLSPLAAEIALFLRARGFALHKCCTEGGDNLDHNTGGLCLTEEPSGAVLVGWATHPTLLHEAGADDRADVVIDMVALFRAWLDRAGYWSESGPVGRTVRVLPHSPAGSSCHDSGHERAGFFSRAG